MDRWRPDTVVVRREVWRGRPWLANPLYVVEDSEGLLATRFDARPGTFYLLRPDQHVCARWRGFDATHVRSAVARATGNL